MLRLGCDIHIEKPSMDVADRVADLRNRVAWLKNVEFCLLGDQNDRLTKIKGERYDMETFNNNLRKQLKIPVEKKTIVSSSEKNAITVKGIESIDNKRNRAIQKYNQLLYIQQCLLDRLESLHVQTRIDQTKSKAISMPVKQIKNVKTITRRIREIQDRLTSVKLINKTLNTCKQHLQCDLDLLRKELPNVQKDIGKKFHQRIILKKEFTDIVDENKRRLKAYQQLLDHTEAQSQQRRVIHEQAMASIAEQLEDQYQVQMMAVNDMTTSFESRRLTSTNGPTINIQQQKSILMSSDEIIQVSCMYDQFYNIILAGLPIDLNNSEQLKIMTNEISAKTVAMLTLTNRMIEEKEQVSQQINRTDKLLKLIEMSINCKNDIRYKILDTMVEQRQNSELFYINDSIEEQNRILRQINDFIIVLSKALCEHIDTQIITEPSTDFIERLRSVFNLISKTKTTGSINENDYQTSPIIQRSGNEENSEYKIISFLL
ncbi:unnamed protein product [Adineta steineri]|uniref:Uncharacterized protein n=1 Tax=Adineta steineri TaxID=433720 RepID=A0A815KGH6_9BILA|nr:unnamed protein product [Adineta steineri]CAF1610929.1 unnamed protein product [Adineta steineri]